jgi:hypothetical protein
MNKKKGIFAKNFGAGGWGTQNGGGSFCTNAKIAPLVDSIMLA